MASNYTEDERKKYEELEKSKTSEWRIIAISLLTFYSIYSAIHGITLQNKLIYLKQKRIKDKQQKGIKLSLVEETQLKEEKIDFLWKVFAFLFPPYGYYRAFKRFSIEKQLIKQKQQQIIDEHNKRETMKKKDSKENQKSINEKKSKENKVEENNKNNNVLLSKNNTNSKEAHIE